MEAKKSVFVTVGTTKFESLIRTVSESDFSNILQQLGFNQLILQIGNGEYEPPEITTGKFNRCVYRFKPSLSEDIKNADLVISHAGAGSCLEVLGERKPLVVVINEELMHNHQLELAQKLNELGYAYYTTCRQLSTVLKDCDLSSLQPFQQGQPMQFSNFVDRTMGFA